MAHLSRETLIAWRDAPSEAARAEVVTHLASCPACAAAYAELVRVAAVAEPPRIFDPETFKARGMAAFEPARSAGPEARRAFRLARWFLVPAGTVVVALVAILLVRPDSDDGNVTRGGTTLHAIAPVGSVATLPAFTWDAPADGDLFRIEIMDASGKVVHDARVRGRSYVLPADAAARLTSGTEYRWMISRVDSRGETLEVSPPALFKINR